MSNRLRTNKKGTSTAALAEEATLEIRQKIVNIYVLLMFAVFPLFVIDLYYDILKEKFYFFFYATLAAAVVCAVIGLVGRFGSISSKKGTAQEKLPFFQKIGRGIKALWAKLTLADKFFFGFVLSVTISTIFSEWPYQAFWGNMGRYQGLLFYLTATAAYVMLRRFYRFRKSHLYALLIAGALVSLWGITDYFGLDVFHFREKMGGAIELLAFSSSIGNINSLTGLLALYLGVTAVLCIASEKWFLVFPALFVFVAGLVGGVSDNAVLSTGCVFALTPFFAFRSKKGVVRYVYMLAVLCLALGVMGVLTVKDTVTTTAANYPWMVGVLVRISMDHYAGLLIGAVVLFGAAFCLSKIWQNKAEEETGPLVKIWGIVCILGVLLFAGVFVMANTGHLPAALAPYKGILVFDDNWGTFRGYVWKKLFEIFGEFPFAKKLFGSGPETFSIFMARGYYYDMMETVGQVFDSPHSEPLQFLFTTGIAGFVTYYGTVGITCARGMKEGGTARVFAFGVIAATAASLVNISVPITTPLVFLSLAIAGSGNDEENS